MVHFTGWSIKSFEGPSNWPSIFHEVRSEKLQIQNFKKLYSLLIFDSQDKILHSCPIRSEIKFSYMFQEHRRCLYENYKLYEEGGPWTSMHFNHWTSIVEAKPFFTAFSLAKIFKNTLPEADLALRFYSQINPQLHHILLLFAQLNVMYNEQCSRYNILARAAPESLKTRTIIFDINCLSF